MESKGDFIIWIILFCALFIIIGLYMSEDTPLNINMKDKILGTNNSIENFTSDSTSTDIALVSNDIADTVLSKSKE